MASYSYTIRKKTLLYFVIVLLFVLSTNKNALTLTTEPLPVIFRENVIPFGKAGIWGQDDLLPEQLYYEEIYTVGDPSTLYWYEVKQQGYVLTDFELVEYDSNTSFRIALIKIEDESTASIKWSCSPDKVVVDGITSRAWIYFYGEVLNTSFSGVTRDVPLVLKGSSNADFSSEGGNAIVRAEATIKWQLLDDDYIAPQGPYRIFGYPTTAAVFYCKEYGNVSDRNCLGDEGEPRAVNFAIRDKVKVASGSKQHFWFEMFAACKPILELNVDPSSCDDPDYDHTATYCMVSLDPFVYIDPEWEYAHEYELKLSPGMPVGPPPPPPPNIPSIAIPPIIYLLLK